MQCAYTELHQKGAGGWGDLGFILLIHCKSKSWLVSLREYYLFHKQMSAISLQTRVETTGLAELDKVRTQDTAFYRGHIVTVHRQICTWLDVENVKSPVMQQTMEIGSRVLDTVTGQR